MMELERVSFENLVWFYRAELVRIRDGVRATNVLSWRERRNLRTQGVIKMSRRKAPDVEWYLTPEALQTLSQDVRS